MMTRAAFLPLAAIVALSAAPASAFGKDKAPIPTLPLVVSIAQNDDGPVCDDAWLDAEVKQADRLFGVHGVRFGVAARRPIDARFAVLETRDDRDALASELQKNVINVMIVESLRDVDDPSLHRRGVHWRPRRDTKKHFVIVVKDAPVTTLAHELGHFFGNGHSQTIGNVMSYARGDGEPFFDSAQGKKIVSSAHSFLRSKELVPFVAPVESEHAAR